MPSSQSPAWPPEWLRGSLALCVLAAIARRGADGAHGYAVAQDLAAAGLGTIKGGTLYPLLGRLEADGHLSASWEPGEGGPGRKTFRLTPTGRAHLAESASSWRAFTHRVGDLVDAFATDREALR